VDTRQSAIERDEWGGTEWYRYDGDGNRIQRTRAGAATFFAHGVWEQDTSTTRTSYGFGGQTIAMREGTSTVSYLHSDHLGSASAATNSSGVLTSWQRFDPWGKVRASANTMPTKQNFTGQYLDDTGLLYYNARYYDPTTARFISADTIAPGKENPQNRNRYAYTLNNPLKYTDPTGHCGQPTDSAAETRACEQIANDLTNYDIHIGDLTGGLWSSQELLLVFRAVEKMANELFGGQIALFREKIGTVNMYQSSEAHGKAWFSGSDQAVAITSIGGWGSSNITFYQSSFAYGSSFFQKTVVHELGHAWDIHSWGLAARDLRLATNSTWDGHTYKPGKSGKTTDYGAEGDREDWAESVAETVFNPPSKGGTDIDPTRERVVRERAK
jgi:RHS repeat-associated protein